MSFTIEKIIQNELRKKEKKERKMQSSNKEEK